MYKKSLVTLASAVLLFSANTAFAGKHHLYNPNPEPLTIVNTISEVDGHIGGFVNAAGDVHGDMTDTTIETILYPIQGKVYTTVTNGRTGETLGSFNEEGTVSSTVTLSAAFFGLMGDWSQTKATLPWSMNNDFSMEVGGSTFNLEESLTGRALPHLGPVEDPMVTGTMAIRMAGCAGIREVSGEGKYAGKVGTLCMNGTFTFDEQFNGKGVSNCTIAVHTPLQ